MNAEQTCEPVYAPECIDRIVDRIKAALLDCGEVKDVLCVWPVMEPLLNAFVEATKLQLTVKRDR